MAETHPSFEQLVRRHRAEITAYLRRLLSDPSDAEDVAQDTWLRAHRAFPRLPPGANVRAWLYRIATNRALTALRRRRDAMQRTSDREIDTLPGRTAAPDAGIRLRAVARAVGSLPAKQRAALVARRFHDLEYDEIGVAIGCSAEAARANVYQAIKKLRELLEQP